MGYVWKPIAEDEFLSLLVDELQACTPSQRAVFERYAITPTRYSLVRHGRDEPVFVVAIREGEALYYEDIEEGFNISPLSESGALRVHEFEQHALRHALFRWMNPETTSDP